MGLLGYTQDSLADMSGVVTIKNSIKFSNIIPGKILSLRQNNVIVSTSCRTERMTSLQDIFRNVSRVANDVIFFTIYVCVAIY